MHTARPIRLHPNGPNLLGVPRFACENLMVRPMRSIWNNSNIKITEAPATNDQVQDEWSNTCVYQDTFWPQKYSDVNLYYSNTFDFEVSRLVPQLSLLKFKISARCYQSPVALFASNLGSRVDAHVQRCLQGRSGSTMFHLNKIENTSVIIGNLYSLV